MKTLLITGGAGFVGSNLVRMLAAQGTYRLVVLDALTYAGNLENLAGVIDNDSVTFVRGSITDASFVRSVLDSHPVDAILHLAAESHVDRSIASPMDFIMTNIVGTVVLLNACRRAWNGNMNGKRFYHVSTDEVYGSLGETGMFTETTPYDPRSPYSASKASSDHLVRAYHHTYALPVVLSNCSNNYGSHQFPEKLIPLFINNIKNNKPLPVYGQGSNVRDWLWVEDHARAIDVIFHQGKDGDTYNIGGHNEWKNLDLVKLLCSVMDKKLGRQPGTSAGLITYVTDRAGHDMRYAIEIGRAHV